MEYLNNYQARDAIWIGTNSQHISSKITKKQAFVNSKYLTTKFFFFLFSFSYLHKAQT